MDVMKTMSTKAMARAIGPMLVGTTVGLAAASCVREYPFVVDDHCANQGGNDWCAARYGGDAEPRPYCLLGNGLCGATPGRDGCVADEPNDDECYSPCGDSQNAAENSSCIVGMETTEGTMSTTDTTTDEPTGSSESSSTTGPMPCMSDTECTEPDAPFCGMTGECGTCSDAPDPDAACAGVDPLLPLCVAGACVACTDANPVVCEDQLLLCDGTTNSCVPCSEHGQCGSGACEIDVGRCFPDDFVVHVDGDPGAIPMPDYMSIAAAVAAVEGTHGVIVVHELDGGADYGPVTIDADKTIALLAAPGENPIIQGTGGNPGLLVQGAGTILYVDGMTVSLSGGVGLSVNDAFAWVDRSRVVQNTGGGILAENNGELTLRNCFVGGGVQDVDVITVDASSLDMLYTTVGGGAFAEQRTRALYCDGAVVANVRNSILVSFDPMPEVECPGATLTNSATESDVGMLTSMWFMGYNAGDFDLSPMGSTTFADIAQWNTGDPPTDIDGDLRPTDDASPDYAGADVPSM